MAKKEETQPLPPADRKTNQARAEHDAEREAYEASLHPLQRPAWFGKVFP